MKKTIAVIALLAGPALASAQAGLNRIQFLALQQELRDQGCGVTNVDGHYGPQTRRAIATCARKFNSANNAQALLVAMNIGFGPNDNPPAGSGATGAAGMNMSTGATGNSGMSNMSTTGSENMSMGSAASSTRSRMSGNTSTRRRSTRRRTTTKKAATDTTTKY